MHAGKLEQYKQLLRLEGFDPEFLDKAEPSWKQLLGSMDIVDQYPIEEETFPSFNPNPYDTARI